MNAQTQEIVAASKWEPPAPMSESAAVASMIERMASDPSIDLARLEKIIELRKSMERDAERRAFNVALAACKAELPQVVKNAENTDNHSKYATLDRIGDAVDAVIAKHGFSLSFNPGKCEIAGYLRIECTVAHSGGHERHEHADLPADGVGLKGTANKTAIHAWGSTMTYGRRYLTMMIFDVKSKIATPDDDGRSASRGEAISQEQLGDLIAIADSVGANAADEKRLLTYFKIERLADLPAKRFDEAVELVQRGAQR